MKHSRRHFLAGSLGLTFGASAFAANGGQPQAKPKESNKLGYRLSSPAQDLQDYYDAVVVGSGYGASVIAARLKSKFPNMCLLERGKEWHPGSFPDYQSEGASIKKSAIHPLGLIDIESGKDIDIVCGNGLGGTSLINAAISIRPEMNVFGLDVWPKELQQDAQSGKLEEYYKKAESVLQPAPTRSIRFGKTIGHNQDTLAIGKKFGELNLNIRPEGYGKEQKNQFGYPQSECTQCGNCCSGCNTGAKNTLLTNYLFIAHQRGVKIFTQVQVEKIEKEGDIYRIHLKYISSLSHNSNVPQKTRTRIISAKHVFLGAGSKGSTQILMKSESTSFQFSKALGTKLSANGDVMGLSYNTRRSNNSLGIPTDEVAATPMEQRPGPIIASYADFRNPSMENDVQSQFLLLDGVVPSALSKIVGYWFGLYGLANSKKFLDPFPESERSTRRWRMLKDVFWTSWIAGAQFPSRDGAINHSMLYFACGHDSSGGRFVLDKKTGDFDYIWKDVLKEKTFLRIQDKMKEFAEKNGGTFVPNPRSGESVIGNRIQATHPLGGCPMGNSVESGVVNHVGQVYDPQGGLHENLYVVDAAILPHSLAATPLLTITALAERISDHVLKV